MIYFFLRSSTLAQNTNPLFYRMHYSPQTLHHKNYALHGIVTVLTLSTQHVLCTMYIYIWRQKQRWNITLRYDVNNKIKTKQKISKISILIINSIILCWSVTEALLRGGDQSEVRVWVTGVQSINRVSGYTALTQCWWT